MASTSANPYASPKASTLATRNLISPNPSKDTQSTQQTSNYASAVAAANQPPTSTATSSSSDDRPVLGTRTQSWNMQDRKREHHEQMFNNSNTNGGNNQGYMSTAQQAK